MVKYEELLIDLLKANKNFIVMTAENRAALREIPNMLGSQFVDVGIAEMTLVGMAAGFALRGRTPIVHALAPFLTMRAFEFIRTDIGYPNLPVKLVGSIPGFLSTANGPTHQAIEDIGLMSLIPNMGIFCPADIDDLMICLPQIFASPQPFYIRYNDVEAIVEHEKDYTFGNAELIYDGNDVTILTYGYLLSQAVKAAIILEENEISVKLINLRTLKPVDEDLLLDSVEKTKAIVTLEDHFETGGLFSIISGLLVQKGITAKVLPINLKENWFKPGFLEDICEYEGFSSHQIVEKILDYLIKNI